MTIMDDADDVTSYLSSDEYLEGNATSFMMIRTYENFVEIVESALIKSINLLEANPKFLQVSEDEITNMICVAMRMAGINSEHDAMEGGHADLVIKSLRHKWLAEAKIKDDQYDYGWIWSGFMQLTERYATNTGGCNRSGLLIYIKQKNVKMVMERWKAHMEQHTEYAFSFPEADRSLIFQSEHAHTRFGNTCTVTHFPLSAYFSPVV